MIQIDMPMPEKCSECRFETEYGYCKAMPENFCGKADDVERPKWCPLKEQEKAGTWEQIDDDTNIWSCSECDEPFILMEGTPIENKYYYCPQCGAKMGT